MKLDDWALRAWEGPDRTVETVASWACVLVTLAALLLGAGR